jgi:prophage regulatory protein
MNDKILRRPEVEERTGLSRSSLYEAIKKGLFPKPLKLTERSVGWAESVINQWIEARIQESKSSTLTSQ